MDDIYAALSFAQTLYAHAYHFPSQQRYREMLTEKRGWITEDVATEFGIGLAPVSKYKIQEVLNANGFSRKTLIDSGLIKYDEKKDDDEASLYHRWTLPLRNSDGIIVSFAGRSIDDNMVPYKRPKWKNLANTSVFQRSECLYPLERVPVGTDSINLVEGYFDAMYAHHHGITNTVCILGTQMTMLQVRILYRRGVRNFSLALDGDLPGYLGAMKAASLIYKEFGQLARLKIAWLPEGKDPDDLPPTELKILFDSAKRLDGGLHAEDKIHPARIIESVMDMINLDLHDNTLKSGGWSTISEFAEWFDPDDAPKLRARILSRFGKAISFKTPYHKSGNSFLWSYND